MLMQHGGVLVLVLLARQSGLCLRANADINDSHKDHTTSDSHTDSKAWMDGWIAGWMGGDSWTLGYVTGKLGLS